MKNFCFIIEVLEALLNEIKPSLNEIKPSLNEIKPSLTKEKFWKKKCQLFTLHQMVFLRN